MGWKKSTAPLWVTGRYLWIAVVAAMVRAFQLLADSGLDVRIVHYSGVSDRFRGLERG